MGVVTELWKAFMLLKPGLRKLWKFSVEEVVKKLSMGSASAPVIPKGAQQVQNPEDAEDHAMDQKKWWSILAVIAVKRYKNFILSLRL